MIRLDGTLGRNAACRWLFRAAWIIPLFASPAPADPGGFQVAAQHARASGQAEAYTAQADDPSAIYYNPAGLTQFAGSALTTGLYIVHPDFEFRGLTDTVHNHEPAYIPHFYASSDFGSDRWRFGLGVNNVFGLSENWGNDGPLRQIVTSAELMVINVAPTLAYRVNDHFSLGAGLNLYHGDLTLNTRTPVLGPPEGAFNLGGDDQALGFTLGALWTLNPRHAIGLVYRSPFHFDLEGSAKIERPGLPTVGPADITAGLDLPQIITLGYAFRPTPKLKLEFDIQYANWETLDRVVIQSPDPFFNALPPRVFGYHDAFSYRFGVQYQFNPTWTLRAGYIFDESATPNHTFTPAVLDIDSHIFTAGVGYSRPRWAVDLAYRFIIGEDRTINNSINSPPGEYTDITHTLMLSFTWRF